jgi:hypothetical protein
MKRLVILMLALAAVAPAAAPADSLTLSLTMQGRQPQHASCPAGAPADAGCQSIAGSGTTRGLGAYNVTALAVLGHRSTGGFASTISGSITTARGSFAFTGDNSAEPSGKAVYDIALTGDGGYAPARGTGTLNFVGLIAGNGAFIVDAVVDGATFDTTPPTLTVRSATSKALGGSRYAITVRYAATDAGGGPVTVQLVRVGVKKPLAAGAATGRAGAVVTLPASVHRITLRLSATDASANTSVRTVTVHV